MANRIKLSGTTSNSFQIGLTGVTINSGNIGPYQLNLPSNVGSNNQVLTSDGTGNLSWTSKGGGGGGSPGGANTQIQFNDDDTFAGSGNLTFNKTTSVLTLVGNANVGNLNLSGNIVDSGPLNIITGTNGNITLQPDGTGAAVIAGNLFVNSISNLGPIENVRISGGNSGFVLTTNGSGNLSWTAPATGGGDSISAFLLMGA